MKAVLLGSGELGKEVAIELGRLGVKVIAVDRYAGAPAMQVTPYSQVIDMTDPDALRRVLEGEQPDLVIPEIEAIATEVLVELESRFTIVPTARGVRLTMDREGIRNLASKELGLKTSPFEFVDDVDQLSAAAARIGLPCVVKPVQSSSGKGQSVLRSLSDVQSVWDTATKGARGRSTRCIVEGFVDFDEEITLLTVRHVDGITFFDPIYHLQKDGDYAESWMPPAGIHHEKAQEMAATVVNALGGYGVFGVELFLKGDEVIFSEVSPRPHDTGLVTLVAGDTSEFAAHARAILGTAVPKPERFEGGAASVPIKVTGTGVPVVTGLAEAYGVHPSVQVRVFGKPFVDGERRVAVVAARGETTQVARANAKAAAARIKVNLM
jgi:Formate-dependent phosphoribosylglycinamide formyltransferase (GAR transformylase)